VLIGTKNFETGALVRYHVSMFIRKRKNPTGSISIQIINKVNGLNKVVCHIGTAKHNDPNKMKFLITQASKALIKLENSTNLSLFDEISIKPRIHTIASRPTGFLEIFGKVFDDVALQKVVSDSIFKNLVIFRIAYPVSKLKTAQIMSSVYDLNVDKMVLYRFMDNLDENTRELLSQHCFQYVQKFTKKTVDVIFFDCTTLHYEAFDEDDFRKMGYSKVGKFNQPQILVALMVTTEGLPVGYEAFQGNTFEGHTLIPVLKRIRTKYKLKNIIFVADSGMLNEDNLIALQESNFEYIVGAKIKNESNHYKKLILNKDNYTSDYATFTKGTDRLIVNYSVERAKKNKADRDRAILRLKKRLVSKNKLTKSLVGNQGARKYLKLTGESTIHWNHEKIEEDAAWDGLKGVITNNTTLTATEAMSRYRSLWRVEKAFRMSKTDLKIRPIFHWKKSRIEAHLAITFTALLVARLVEIKSNLSTEKIVEALKYVCTVKYEDLKTGEIIESRTDLPENAKIIYKSIGVPF